MDLSRWLSHRADWDGGKTALRFEGREVSYGELDAEVRRLAAGLKHFGIGEGDRVAHLGCNSPELLQLLFACARLGAILVPLNWRLAVPEHLWILQDSGAQLLIAETDFAGHVQELANEMSELRCLYFGGVISEGQPALAAALAEAGGDDANRNVGLGHPVQLVYTSGTTGQPKGAVLTQEALFYNALNAVSAQEMTAEDHVLTVLPMFHVGGMNIQTTPALSVGATVTLHRRFEPAATLHALAEDRPSLFLAVPAVIAAMAAQPDWVVTDVSCLRAIGVGSSTVPEPLLWLWLDRGVPVTQIYGLTETAPVAVCLPIRDAWRKLGSTGKAAAWCEMKVADDAGRELSPGEKGEILLRGPNVMRAYWNNPKATEEAFIDGWFRTGDIGHCDEDGYLTVDDRKKDMVISGGENIYPAELENVLAECPQIAEFAVVGQPDEKWGEVAVACVVRQAGSGLSGEDVLALFEGRLARFKHPRAVLFLDALPRNAMGKVLKFELRRRLAGGRATEVSS